MKIVGETFMPSQDLQLCEAPLDGSDDFECGYKIERKSLVVVPVLEFLLSLG